MTSLRTRLLIILIASTSAIWLCGFGWIYINSQREIQHLLDRRLMEAARMVLSLSAPVAAAGSITSPMALEADADANFRYERRLYCQVWSFDGHLVGRSGDAPASELTEQKTGFSERVVDGSTYRVYAAEDAAKGVRVLVGDNLGQRHAFVRDLLRGLLVPAAVMLPLIGVLIWGSVRRGLRPLELATQSLTARDAENLTPLDVGRAPSEIRPVINALNGLFGKVVASREHERSFLAYAAHEMRTPLAGLKTQVQIAARATDSKMRDGALSQALKGVDRTSRLVTQLLTMSRLNASTAQPFNYWINLEAALQDITINIGQELDPERVAIDTSICGRSIAMDRELFDLAARNLVENALQLSPANGIVRLSLLENDGVARVCIEDDGPGIPADEEALVVQPFFRGRFKSATGSGLGLAIVTSALDHAGAELRLCRPDAGQGLRAEIVIAHDRLRRDAA